MIPIYIRTKLRSYWRSERYFFCTRLSCTNIVRLGLLHFNCSLSWRFLFLWPSSLLSHHIVWTYQSKVSHVISHAFFTHTNTRTSLWFKQFVIRWPILSTSIDIFSISDCLLSKRSKFISFSASIFFLKGVNLQVRKTESSFFSIDSGRDRDEFKTREKKNRTNHLTESRHSL